jgi:hypothetical protein
VAGYSGFRIFEETLRIDYSNYVLGMRVNFWIATLLCLAGLAWFAAIQRSWPVWPRRSGRGRSVVAGRGTAEGVLVGGRAGAGSARRGAPETSAPAAGSGGARSTSGPRPVAGSGAGAGGGADGGSWTKGGARGKPPARPKARGRGKGARRR